MSIPSTQPEKTQATPTIRKSQHRLPIGWVICGIALLAVIGWYAWRKMHPTDNVGPLMMGTVVKGDLLYTVSATGSVEAQTGAQIRIGSQVTGRIKHLYADVGSKVKAGQIIAELDLPDVAAAVSQSVSAEALTNSKVVQSGQNLLLGKTQTTNAVLAARQAVNVANDSIKTANANLNLQSVQTPTDIRKAVAAREQAIASLATAKATYDQTVAGANFNIAASQEAVDQAKATSVLNQATYNRQKELGLEGMVAAMVVDQAIQALHVSESLLRASQQQLELMKQKVAADLKTANAAVVLAQKGVESALAVVDAANAEVYTTRARQADVNNAISVAKGAQANLQLAIGNLETNSVNEQSVVQSADAKRQAQDQVSINKAQFAKTILRTPISGTVLSLTSQQGETVAAGLAAPTLVIVTDLSRLEVEAYVDETDVGKVRVGQAATVTVDAFPGKTFTGKVTKTAAGSTIQVGVITYDISVSISDPSLQLRPDMTANVTIQTGHVSNALLIPAVAIQHTVKGSFVKVAKKVNGQTKISLVPVKTGGTDGVSVEILTGLTEGEQIVLAGGQTSAPPSATGSPLAGGGGGGGRGR
jgi:HlyD family secretion protein